MSFTDPCDVSDDVIPGHVNIGTCDMLSVLPRIRFILNRCLVLKPQKGPPNDHFCHMVVKTQYLVHYSDPVQHPHKKGNSVTCGKQSLMMSTVTKTVNKDNHSSFCRWCTYLASLYKKCGYILGGLRPQQFLEDVIETVNSQNWYNYMIGFDTSFHSMI